MKVIFVHGTGVREPVATETFSRIASELNKRRIDWHVDRVNWGGTVGSYLRGNGLSIPNHDTARSIGRDEPRMVSDSQLRQTLWDLLLKDSLYELRLLALVAEAKGSTRDDTDMHDSKPKVNEVLDRASKLSIRERPLNTATEKLWQMLVQAGLELDFQGSLEYVVQSNAAYTVANGRVEPDFPAALARAIVADVISVTRDAEPLDRAWKDQSFRDMLADQLEGVITNGTSTRGGALVDWVQKQLIGLAINAGKQYGTARMRLRRGSLTDHFFGFPGDILYYQAHGEAIRDEIAGKVRSSTGPVILVGHSLGGVACVELLITCQLPKVVRLITVGSQAPFFYELDALVTMPFQDISPEDRLPEHFPPWTNFFDQSDFLSYIGEKLFGKKITDIQVDNGLLFPDAHSGYWKNGVVFDKIVEGFQ